MTTIAFHSNQLSVRGTETALFDYATFNQRLLGNESIILYPKKSVTNNAEAVRKFESKFLTIPYNDFSEVDHLIRSHHAEFLYAIKSGEIDGIVSSVVPTMVHAVFPVLEVNYHGSAFAFVSDWLSKVFSNNKVPSVPHMVHLPDTADDLRRELRIPTDALVFGCYGGRGSFDILFVKDIVIPEVVKRRRDIYFIFLNIDKFVEHSRVIFLPASADMHHKVRFINTTDAMLHARKLGESFGLACGEFSIRNKPIITYGKSKQRSHLTILGGNAFGYTDSTSLLSIIFNFDRNLIASKNWDFYSSAFSPASVMERFDKYFIRTAARNGLVQHPGLRIGISDKIQRAINLLDIQRLRL